MKSGVRAFGLVFGTLLIDVAAMGMMIPVLPEIIVGFVGGDFGRAAQLGGIVAALTAGLGYFPGAPFALGAVLVAVAPILAWSFLRPRASASESVPTEEPEDERVISQAA